VPKACCSSARSLCFLPSGSERFASLENSSITHTGSSVDKRHLRLSFDVLSTAVILGVKSVTAGLIAHWFGLSRQTLYAAQAVGNLPSSFYPLRNFSTSTLAPTLFPPALWHFLSSITVQFTPHDHGLEQPFKWASSIQARRRRQRVQSRCFRD